MRPDDPAPAPTRLADYRPPDHLIDRIELDFDLYPAATIVTARLHGRRNPAGGDGPAPLLLDGEGLETLSLRLDGAPLAADAHAIDADGRLCIPDPGPAFTLESVCRIDPAANSALEGLYLSNGMYCTQCEAEGFRRITWFPDRPDVMARWTVRMAADRASHPVLLSNGNPVAAGELPEGRHYAVWDDPFPKPSYLFALVAGDLARVEDRHVTGSGRAVTLRIFVEPGDERRCAHAMRALKQAMAWDESVFGLEYDLDLFLIVAVSHFNMGAMENKGLNIFNSKYVLADPQSATDEDYRRIEAIIAHEYFHNWTGNRVTCRDWFQLSLKEGLTVYRDQEFSADQHSRAVKRIEDARLLRALQFPEDAGPLAHPVRPDSYIEINNFYTLTVYEKGAELVRMIARLVGEAGFRRGLALYLRRHDGEAVTCEQFVAAMEAANGADLGRFRRWYAQAGTPHLTVNLDHDRVARTATLTVRQHTPPTPGQTEKSPLEIPLAIGLLGPDGAELPLNLQGATDNERRTTRLLRVREAEQHFVFTDIPDRPVPSLLRGFSAPVIVEHDYEDEDLALLMASDPDAFARWDAGQTYAIRLLLAMIAEIRAGRTPALDPRFIAAVGASLADPGLEPAFRAEVLRLPGESVLADAMDLADPAAVHRARRLAMAALGRELRPVLLAEYHRSPPAGTEAAADSAAMGQRDLRDAALACLVAAGGADALALAAAQAHPDRSMTDIMGALAALNPLDCPERVQALAAFHDRWRHDPLVLDKWFSLRATAPFSRTLSELRGLMQHPGFDMGNPNRVRALIGAFAGGNPVCFHATDGEGYRFLADQVLALDAVNPQTAARLLGPLTRWRRQLPVRQALMRRELERVAGHAGLSRDSGEIAARSLAPADPPDAQAVEGDGA